MPVTTSRTTMPRRSTASPRARRPVTSARPHLPTYPRRKPQKPSKGQMLLGAMAKVLPTGTTDTKRRRRSKSKAQANQSHKGRNGLMLLAAGAAAAVAKKRRDDKHEKTVVTEPVTPVAAHEPAVADAPGIRTTP